MKQEGEGEVGRHGGPLPPSPRNRSPAVFGSSPGRFSADQVANFGSKPLPARTALDPIGGREKLEGRLERVDVHVRQFPGLVGSGRIAVRVVDVEVFGRRGVGR